MGDIYFWVKYLICSGHDWTQATETTGKGGDFCVFSLHQLFLPSSLSCSGIPSNSGSTIPVGLLQSFHLTGLSRLADFGLEIQSWHTSPMRFHVRVHSASTWPVASVLLNSPLGTAGSRLQPSPSSRHIRKGQEVLSFALIPHSNHVLTLRQQFHQEVLPFCEVASFINGDQQ